jgi:pilus assembly protein CpaE
MENRILVVDDDPISLQLVSSLLTGHGYRVVTAQHPNEGLSILADQTFDLAILDVLMPDMDGYELCRRVRSNPKTAQLPIVLLTALDTLDQKIRGFEAGADDYIAKPFEPKELLARIEVLIRRVGPKPALEPTAKIGKVIGVYSLRGGVGVSTLAANLAAGLAQLWDKPTVLVDLVFTAGQSSLFMNIPLKKTWADLVYIPDNDIDIDLLEILLLPHTTGARVLASPARPEQSELITTEKVELVLNILRTYYDYVILDLPHNFSETTLVGLDASDEILALLAPDLASVRNMSITLNTFQSLEISEKSIHVVLNRTFKHHGLARKDIEDALKHKVDLVIPFTPDPLVNAINVGVPTVFGEPESPLGAFFEDISFLLSKAEHKEETPKAPTDAWQRINARVRRRKEP